MPNQKIWALIPAAGSGSRMQSSVKKQFMTIQGEPLLSHTLRVFNEHPLIDGIAIVTGLADIPEVQKIALPFQKVGMITGGGATRQESVYAGLQVMPADCDIVLIHDAARPMVTPELISDCIRCTEESGCAIAATPVKDTIKRTSPDGYVLETPERANLWNVQTPQSFRYADILAAHKAAAAQGDNTCTDDGAVMERYGSVPVRLIPGIYQNIKITTPEDRILAEYYLGGQHDDTNL